MPSLNMGAASKAAADGGDTSALGDSPLITPRDEATDSTRVDAAA